MRGVQMPRDVPELPIHNPEEFYETDGRVEATKAEGIRFDPKLKLFEPDLSPPALSNAGPYALAVMLGGFNYRVLSEVAAEMSKLTHGRLKPDYIAALLTVWADRRMNP